MIISTIKGFELEIRIDADCESIDFYNTDGNLEASFTAEPYDYVLDIKVEDVRISKQREGIYTEIINTILFNDTFHDLLKSEFEEIETASFTSSLRSEQACNFWTKRGYEVSYNETEHQNGEQELIEINLF